jgi:tripartite-type tricarboxylate transporter receptor subunit TctC
MIGSPSTEPSPTTNNQEHYMRRHFTVAIGRIAAIAAVWMAPLDPVSAQSTYPQKAIKIVVDFPAGSTPDVAARLLGEKLQAAWDKPIIVENIPGAGGNLATAHTAKAEADGHTLLMADNCSIVINPHVYMNRPYDSTKDLAPVSVITSTPNLLVVPSSIPTKSVQELVALARAKPDELTYGHGGVGISQHLAGELFKDMAKVAVRPVPYKAAHLCCQILSKAG